MSHDASAPASSATSTQIVALSKITLENFKSYGGRVEATLDGDFTVICGKNGSGKSSLVDALLFVLSGKDERGATLRGLVNDRAGTDRARVDLEFATVEERGPPAARPGVAFGTTTVSRAIRGGRSKLYLDGAPVATPAFRAFLRAHNLHIPRSFCMTQSRVVAVAAAAGLDLLRFVEAVVGTDALVARIDDARAALAEGLGAHADLEAEQARVGAALERAHPAADELLAFQARVPAYGMTCF